MALVQLGGNKKKVAVNSSNNDEKHYVIGIDFGTTNCVVATYVNEGVKVIPTEQGDTVQSVISYGNEVSIGKNANIDDFYIKSIKRLMGRGGSDLDSYGELQDFQSIININSDGHIYFNINNKQKSVVEVACDIFTYLKAQASNYLGMDVSKAVITVPAYFDEVARMSIMQSAQLAGLEVMRLINEPTAAALAYGILEKKGGLYLVYDLGGGTFDVSVLNFKEGIFKVLSTGGDSLLGGDDITNSMLQVMCSDIDTNSLTKSQYLSLWNEINKIKEDFINKDTSYTAELFVKELNHTLFITYDSFKNIVTEFINKTIHICNLALQDAAVTKNDIHGVILVGGSTQLTLVPELLAKEYMVEIFNSIPTDTVVAQGAAYQAAQLAGLTKKALLLDVCPLSLSIETADGLVEKIIDRNTTLPVAKAIEFTTFKNNQTGMKIHVLQGEREVAEDNRSLAKFTLKGLPKKLAGVVRVLVTFSLDVDGILNVTAEEKSLGLQCTVDINPTWGISQEKMSSMLLNSLKHGKEDIQKRLKIENIVSAKRTIEATEAILSEHSDKLLSNDIDKIKTLISQLKLVILNNDYDEILKLHENLKEVLNPLAEELMDSLIHDNIVNKTVSDVLN